MLNTQDLLDALPDLSTDQVLSGLHATTEICRDSWGIPHIKAQSETDLYFAQGFATAQDRLWHMDYDRHRALGRWAEWIGPSGIAQDRLLRSAGMGPTAQLDYQAASPAARAMADAYTAGVNAFLNTTQTLPVEYKLLGLQPEPWENWHCLAVYKMRNSLLGTFEAKLLRTDLLKELGPDVLAKFIKGYPQDHLLTVPPGSTYTGPPLSSLEELNNALSRLTETDPGSNAWSIAGNRCQSGLPLIAGDSHRALDTPNVYYQIHLTCPSFNISGYSVPGMPGALHFCHNDYVAWGMTYGSADTQDLFIERFRNTTDGRTYLFKGKWLAAQVRQETIQVRDNAPIEFEVTRTHHGPIIAGDPVQGDGIAIADPGLLAGTPWLDAAHDAMQATSVAALHHALRNWTDRVNNYAVADTQGHFGYLHAGKIPLRPQANGWSAVPGWTGEHEWNGYIPHNELPCTIDPDVGYAVSCNQRVTGHEYPYYVGLYFSPDFRARRIRSRLLEFAPNQATPEAMAQIHADRLSYPAKTFIQALTQIKPTTRSRAQALGYLATWNGHMDRDAVAPTLYSCVRWYTVKIIIEHLCGETTKRILNNAGADAHLRLIALEIVQSIESGDTSLLPPESVDWLTLLTTALDQAIHWLENNIDGPMDNWHWGKLHKTQPQHPLSAIFPDAAKFLDPPSLPVHGDGDTPLAGSYANDNPFTVTGLSVNRYIYNPAAWEKSLWIVPLGASGHPASPHYADQAECWSNVQFIPQLWDWDQIRAKAKTYQRLTPIT